MKKLMGAYAALPPQTPERLRVVKALDRYGVWMTYNRNTAQDHCTYCIGKSEISTAKGKDTRKQ